MVTIRHIPPPKFKSEAKLVELIRGMLDEAKNNQITYLEINFKIKGEDKIRSKSIITRYDH